jgi:hypothetical protein
MSEASAVPAARAAAVLLWIVAAGWGLSAPWLMWWVLVRDRLPVLPMIGEPNGGPFYFNFSHGTFVVFARRIVPVGIRSGVGGLAPVDRPALGGSASAWVASS